ncbi:GNAT family N-acetyltransferase [Paenibacillus donghaensis]|uniref:GNAT family N-acetyltransferase n=1 Tax=Paenibacillus donghaensis TaxID=414771 RepID=UPI0018841ED9|nr:GNAT family N-acetyltransferase [Paenibacillus donghaensis]MBE9915272.1 GNAT family N-acetyltransferase [Paenibacillus donghaensis]
MNVTVEFCTLEDKFIIYNLYPLYLHDLAEIRKVMPNQYGVFEDSDDYKTLQEEQAVFDIWWQKENILFPYLIRVDGLPAGFGLVATPPYLVDESEFMMNEFFIARPFRGKGVGEQAAVSIFNLFPGKWMLFTTEGENNVRTQNFWRKTISNLTSNRYTESDEDLPHFGISKVFRFENNLILE